MLKVIKANTMTNLVPMSNIVKYLSCLIQILIFVLLKKNKLTTYIQLIYHVYLSPVSPSSFVQKHRKKTLLNLMFIICIQCGIILLNTNIQTVYGLVWTIFHCVSVYICICECECYHTIYIIVNFVLEVESYIC